MGDWQKGAEPNEWLKADFLVDGESLNTLEVPSDMGPKMYSFAPNSGLKARYYEVNLEAGEVTASYEVDPGADEPCYVDISRLVFWHDPLGLMKYFPTFSGLLDDIEDSIDAIRRLFRRMR